MKHTSHKLHAAIPGEHHRLSVTPLCSLILLLGAIAITALIAAIIEGPGGQAPRIRGYDIPLDMPNVVFIAAASFVGMLMLLVLRFSRSAPRSRTPDEPLFTQNHPALVTQDELAHARALLEEAGRMANVGGWELNTHTNELRWTDQTYRIHDLEVGTYVTVESAIDFYTGDSKERIQRHVRQCLLSGKPWDDEFTMRTASGRDIWIRTIGTPEVRDGVVHRIYGTIQDITEIHSTLREIQKAKNDAESASQAKSMFLANMSHEMRTPLTAILGNADLLANDPDFVQSPELMSGAIEAIQRNADHLLAIINDVLDSSKIDAGMMRLESISMNPSAVIGEAIEMLAPKLRGKDVTISAVYRTEMPRVIESDPTRVRQILINLIGNAIKFTEKGEILVEVAYNTLPDMAGMLILKIIDTGIGISRESLESLTRFEAFNQADGSMTRRYGGTGLGLRITNSLINLFGGSLIFDSEPGVGTTVTASIRVQPVAAGGMWLPPEIRQLEDASTKKAASTNERSLKDVSILLVEDGEDNRKLITYMLERAGAQVVTAINGGEAVYTYKDAIQSDEDQAFDIILMDMQMPEVDGYSATTMLRSCGYTGPIIALTAHAMAGDRERCIEAGCQEYLTKPIKAPKLIKSCVRLLGFNCGYTDHGYHEEAA